MKKGAAQALVALFDVNQTSALVGNLDTELTALDIGGAVVPLTRNDGEAATCYLCCPSSAYIDYARAEFRHFRTYRFAVPALDALLRLGYPLIRLAGLDRQVQPNNWLLATNLLPPLTPEAIATVTATLVARAPRHAIVWRSINDRTDAALLRAFEDAGYGLFPARQIYLFDSRRTPPRRSRDEARDDALLRRPDYAIVDGRDFRPDDFERAEELYRQLYLVKYTPLNPRYTAVFMAAMAEQGLLTFQGLRGQDGTLDGVIAFFERGDAMTAPIVGYDTSLPQSLGLYRRLVALSTQRARANRRLLNMSAGAASFKRNRSGVPAIEYSAIFTNHLPFWQRAAAWLVRRILRHIGLPLLRRFEL